ncbi:J domain-containing protein [Clostridium sp.]|uniref:J domain-containing protein n=1 Tax=Clostridium sp. TaxID=1506 RepID=UPI00284A4094|nr:J domain-containing protein [Clostridium sp.]MDR3594120.1 J domain-containing protein [Clostridium sp.]
MDPYKVLDIDITASEEEIKDKFKYMVEEYSQNQDVETKQKILTLSAAYEKIINGNLYKEIRDLIDNKNFSEAEAKLNLINNANSAEWNYLQGFISVQKGWFESGLNYLKNAVQLEPDNYEYLNSLNSLQSRIIEYMKKYSDKKVKQPNSNNMNPCGGDNSNNSGGMC